MIFHCHLAEDLGEVCMKKVIGSVRVQMIMICLISMALMQAALLSSYYQFRELKIQDNRVRFQELLSQVTTSVELNCTYLNEILEQIAYNNEVQTYLENTELEYRRNNQEQIQSFLNSMAKLRSGIKDIAILDDEGNCTSLNSNIYQVREFSEEIPGKCLYYYTGKKELLLTGRKVEGFTVGAQVYSTSDFTKKEKIGTVLISFNVPCILSFAGYRESEYLPAMLVYDREKNLVFSSVEEKVDTDYGVYFDCGGQLLAKEVATGDQVYYVESKDLEMIGGKIVFLISESELFSGMEKLQERLRIFEIFTITVLLLLNLFFMNRIIKPLNQFMGWLTELKNGNLKLMKQPVMLKGATEIEVMADQFNGMMKEINDLTHRLMDTASRLYESELEKQKAELTYMHSQINPHFLFNTLESVKGCAIEEGAQRTFRMVHALGKIFRYCVRSGDMVTLREEAAVADSYMYLQQIRFEKRLTYINRLRDEVLDAVIPKMILQPLLENAVIHGIEECNASAIWLDGWISEQTLILTVTDDGDCVSAEKLAQLQDGLRGKDRSSHIGISNIYNRLRYIYGEAYGLELMEPEKGFGVRLRLPLAHRTKEEKGEWDSV